MESTIKSISATVDLSTPENNADKDEFTLDSILIRIGQFGKFQLFIFILICIPMMFNAIFSVTYVFTASTVTYRCNITECDTANSRYDEHWTSFSIPNKTNSLDQCKRYASRLQENTTTGMPKVYGIHDRDAKYYDDGATYGDTCKADNFDQNQIEICSSDNLIFRDNEVTISNDFDIFCSDEWKLSLVGTLNNIGQFIGIPLGGFISDRYGRVTALALGGFVAAFLGIIRSFATSYTFFVIFEFLDSMASSPLYSICFIVGIELVGPKRRVIACSLITIFYAIGEMLLALGAKYYPNWRILLRIMYVPALSLVVYFWILPESVRWLLSQSREDEAKNILKRAARVNKRKLSDHSLDKLVLANREKLQNVSEGKFPIKQAFSKLFWRIANCSFCWIVNVLVYYGLSLNAVLLDGNKYNNFIYIALVEIPGFLLPLLIMDRFGRRYSLFGCMFISGLCCLATIFMPPDSNTLQLCLFLIGKLTITASFQVLYFFTSEIFPTNLRNSLLSFCSMMGRFGSMLAPQTPLLAKYYENAPAILFATTAIISAFLTLLFPETTNLILPTTMKEANNIGSSKEKKSSNNATSLS
ncbi:solute carrier family 22 member 3 [Lucilia cuprina]|uniref:solute carrier family 22 member 3 n=1 Tax=Lucilia cuprina TaxID=7375 RepID=UPI001F05F306|nr:solute carrier family 22 member 3 [Lucilia cuprina]